MTQSSAETQPGPSPPTPNAEQRSRTGREYMDANRESPLFVDKLVVDVEDIRPDDVVIAVMGLTGSGKSALIRSASGRETHGVGHGLKSFTSKVLAIRFLEQECGRQVVLVDTPGFDNTHKSDKEILNMILDWLESSYKRNILLSGILYLHRITDKHMAGTPLKNLQVFQRLCGKNALEKVYLTTTMWDEVDLEAGENTLVYLQTNYWKAMVDRGAQIARCRIDDDSPKELIRRILHDKSTPKALLIPHEMRLHIPACGVSPRIGEKPLAMVNVGDLEPDDIVIAVFGPTGSGKSAFINSASGCDTQGVGHTLKAFTNEVGAIKFWDQEIGRHVVLVDTPGFDSTFKSDSSILLMISQWLQSSYDRNKLLDGILYLHRITDNRMAGTPLKNLRIFQHLCGKDALEKVYLTTTMWDEVDPGVGERRLAELKADYWEAMINHGAQIACCRTDDDSPRRLVRDIVSQEGGRKVLLIQQEMVNLKKEFKETAAGKQVCSQLEDLVERQVMLLRRINEERKGASSPDVLAGLQAEYNSLREQMDNRTR